MKTLDKIIQDWNLLPKKNIICFIGEDNKKYMNLVKSNYNLISLGLPERPKTFNDKIYYIHTNYIEEEKYENENRL